MSEALSTWKIGILFSRSGEMQIPSSQHVAGALLAIDQINASGGIAGRPIEPVEYDAHSDAGLYRQYAERLLTEDGVRVIIGCSTSHSRKAVLPLIERRNGLLWYPDLYEGFEYSPNVIYSGAATNQNSLPLARHLFRSGARRFVLVGSDYIYPREVNRVMRDLVERHGGEVLDEQYLPMQTTAARLVDLVDRTLALAPDVVFSTLVGRCIVDFCRAYADAGVDPAVMPIASHNITEAELVAVGRRETAGHITAAPYFSSVATETNARFVDAFRRRLGPRAPVSQYAASAYGAVQLLALALERAGSMEPERLVRCASEISFDGPQGRMSIDGDNNHAWLTPRLGRWNGVDAFDLLWEADEPVQPDPWLVTYGGIENLHDIAPSPAS